MPDATEPVSRTPLRTAMEARDLPAVRNAFAPDATFHSPLTEKLTFNGREQIGLLTSVLFEVFEDFHYTDELVGRESGFLVARAKVGGEPIEMVDHFQLDDAGRIADMTVFFRPLPAAAAALRAIGAGLGRRKSRARGAVMSILTQPLAVMTRVGDGIGIGLVRGSL